MTTQTAIAQKLNIAESAIIRIEEWSNVLFVVIKGIGARFVSKKVKEEDAVQTSIKKALTGLTIEQIKRHYKISNFSIIPASWSSQPDNAIFWLEPDNVIFACCLWHKNDEVIRITFQLTMEGKKVSEINRLWYK